MTAAHIIYIPGVLIVGIVLGFLIGQRAERDAIAAAQRKRTGTGTGSGSGSGSGSEAT